MRAAADVPELNRMRLIARRYKLVKELKKNADIKERAKWREQMDERCLF